MVDPNTIFLLPFIFIVNKSRTYSFVDFSNRQLSDFFGCENFAEISRQRQLALT